VAAKLDQTTVVVPMLSFCQEQLRAYAQVLLSRSCLTGAVILAATLLAPQAALLGLSAVLVSSLVARAWKLERGAVAEGMYGYNALLVGLGIGHTVTSLAVALPLVVVAAAITVVVTAAVKSWLGRTTHLPVLSLPFLIVFGLLCTSISQPRLEPPILAMDPGTFAMLLPPFASTFLRNLGSIFFLPSVEAGAFVVVALLIHSRIASALALLAFALVQALGAAFPAALDAHTLSVIACNGMLAAVAVGGVWFVPSLAATAWAVGAVLLCAFLTLGIVAPLARLGTGPLFVPFNLAALCVLLAARERTRDLAPKSVDFIPGTPEENLDYFRTRLARFQFCFGLRFRLPCRGWWTCTQAVDGEHTHQGRWRHAFDFEVMGQGGTSFRGDGRSVEDYFCYRLPVLATAAGTVVKVVDVVADNPVGDVNLKQNWGNLVMLQHGPSLFSLVAHLAPGSCKVREGQTVQRGDVLGLCGNSGRSPVPHVHFQVQATPLLGADTLPVAFHDAVTRVEGDDRLAIALAPAKNAVIRNLEPGEALRAQFNFHDGDVWTYQVGTATEALLCEVDLLGQLRLRSRERAASMAFERSEDCFISYDVVGDRNSVLQLLRAALPRVPLEENPRLVWRDFVPIRAAVPRLSMIELRVPLHGTTGVEVEYAMTQQRARWVIAGESIRRDRQGVPVLRTRVEFDHGAGPLAIDVTWRDQHRRAIRLLADAPDVRGEPQASRTNHENAYAVVGHHRTFEPSLPLDHGHGGTPDRRSGRLSGVL
jgi:urea transporter